MKTICDRVNSISSCWPVTTFSDGLAAVLGKLVFSFRDSKKFQNPGNKIFS